MRWPARRYGLKLEHCGCLLSQHSGAAEHGAAMPLSGTNLNHLGPLRHLTAAPELGLLVEPGLSLLALETALEKILLPEPPSRAVFPLCGYTGS